MFWIKLVAALFLFAFGLSASKDLGFWIQSQFLDSMSGVDERAALVSAVISSLLLGVSAFPASILIFKRINQRDVSKKNTFDKDAARVPTEPSEALPCVDLHDEVEKLPLGLVASSGVQSKSDDFPKQTKTEEHFDTMQNPVPHLTDASLVLQSDVKTPNAKVQLIIEYSPEARGAWEAVQKLPAEYQVKFLSSLEVNPILNAGRLLSDLIEAHKRTVRPFDDEDANDALENVRTISKEAEQEFLEVYSLLGEKLALHDIVHKLEGKYGLSLLSKAKISEQREEEARTRAIELEARKKEIELELELENAKRRQLEIDNNIKIELQRREAEKSKQDENFKAFRAIVKAEELRRNAENERLESRRLRGIMRFLDSSEIALTGILFVSFIAILLVLWVT